MKATIAAAVEVAALPAAPYRGPGAVAPHDERWKVGQRSLAGRHAAEVEHLERVRAEREERRRTRSSVLLTLLIATSIAVPAWDALE